MIAKCSSVPCPRASNSNQSTSLTRTKSKLKVRLRTVQSKGRPRPLRATMKCREIMWGLSYLDAVSVMKHFRIRKSDIGTWLDVKGPVNNIDVLPPPEVLKRRISDVFLSPKGRDCGLPSPCWVFQRYRHTRAGSRIVIIKGSDGSTWKDTLAIQQTVANAFVLLPGDYHLPRRDCILGDVQLSRPDLPVRRDLQVVAVELRHHPQPTHEGPEHDLTSIIHRFRDLDAGQNWVRDSHEKLQWSHSTVQIDWASTPTLPCRMAHQPMVPIRPSVHCSHIGPSESDYCEEDRTYGSMVQEPSFTNQPFVPYGYADSDATVSAQ